MEARSHESPMDFEWQNAGPADPSSPFHKFSESVRQRQTEGADKKQGDYSVFDSPSKSTSFGASASQPQSSFFSPNTTFKPPPSFREASFMTPRKFDLDPCSSGPENASSPENADNEDTPDAPRMQNFTANNGAAKPEKKSSSIFGRFASPGRGEIRRGVLSDNVTHRVRKRKRRELDRDNGRLVHHSSQEWDSAAEEEDLQDLHNDHKSRRHSILPSTVGPIPALFAWLESHPHLPHVLSFYAQLLLNVFTVLFIIYLVFVVVSTIRSDVNSASEKVMSEILAEMATCAQQYVDNKCDKSNRVPALESVCSNWEQCMNRDPNAVGRARVSAQTFAQILNSFIEPISYKALVFILTIVFGCVAISNAAFVFFRSKVNEAPPQHGPPQTPHYPHYPVTTPYSNHQSHWMPEYRGPPQWQLPPLPPPTPSEKNTLARSPSPRRRPI